MTDPKLIPCPKCGGTMKIKLWNDGYMGQNYQAVCTECGLSSGVRSYNTIVKEWAASEKSIDYLSAYIYAIEAREKMKKTRRKKIYVCAPYRGTIGEILQNRKLTIDRCRSLYEQGYNPIAPQLYYPLFLLEEKPNERRFGLDAGLEWLAICDEMIVFGEIVSAGMKDEIMFAKTHAIPIIYVPDK